MVLVLDTLKGTVQCTVILSPVRSPSSTVVPVVRGTVRKIGGRNYGLVFSIFGTATTLANVAAQPAEINTNTTHYRRTVDAVVLRRLYTRHPYCHHVRLN